MCDTSYRLERLENGWVVGRFAALAAVPGLVHAVTTRQALDVGLIRHDHAAAASQAGRALGLAAVAYADQVHGSVVFTADRGGRLGEGDGLASRETNLGLMTRSADCPLILAVESDSQVIGTAHASWRGTVAGVTSELVRRMTELGANAAKIIACVCPSAGPCCYEVGAEVRDAAVKELGLGVEPFFLRKGSSLHFDLWQANRWQLLQAGLAAHNIHLAEVCTICSGGTYPSHRREADAAGRFLAMIGWSERPR